MINWKKLTKEDSATIREIVQRARKLLAPLLDNSDLDMDISAAHLSCPMKLTELLNTDDLNFAHDVIGIVNHIDRTTGKLEDCFVPRYAA